MGNKKGVVTLEQVFAELQILRRQNDEILKALSGAPQPAAVAVAVPSAAAAASTPVVEKAASGGAGAGAASGPADVFISYCWTNSKDAERLQEVGSAVGTADPRAIQQVLKEQHGRFGWLDKEQLGEQGLFEDIADGLISARAVVAFISDEYANSDNCKMEFQYARKTLRIPIVAVIVGSGWAWQKTTIGLLLAGELYIDMTNGPEAKKMAELVGRLEKHLGPAKAKAGPAGAGSNVGLTKKIIKQEEAAAKQFEKDQGLNPQKPKVGDRFERHVTERQALSFSSTYSKTKIKDEGTGDYLDSLYWWPVDVTEVNMKKGQCKIHYLSYSDQWDLWVSFSDLRAPVQPTSSRISLESGMAVEVRLVQRGSPSMPYAYAWTKGHIMRFEGDRVRVKLEVGKSTDRYFDECIVGVGAVRYLLGDKNNSKLVK